MTTRKLDDTKWSKIYAFLRITPHIYTGNEQKTRMFIEAVYWVMRTGAPWRDLPDELGKWNSVFNRYADWADKEVWLKMMTHFSDDPDMEWLLLDSTIVRAHPCAAGAPKKKGGQAAQSLGRSRGGFSTKIHVNVDALGNPLRLILTAGQASDSPQAFRFSPDSRLIPSLLTEDMMLRRHWNLLLTRAPRVSSLPEKTVLSSARRTGIGTKSAVWLSDSSIKSSIIVASLPVMRNMPTVTWLFCALPLR